MSLHHWPNPRVPWRSFHNHWVVKLVEYLNQGVLPEGFQARPTELIVGIEPDVLLLQQADQPNGTSYVQPALKEATLTAVLPPPADVPLVGIYSAYDMSRLIAVIELVSPDNKDRPETMQAFVEKVLFLLQDGVHVMVLDVINWPARPVRQLLLQRLGLSGVPDGLWVSSYCSLSREDLQTQSTVREWAEPVTIGEVLPALPLFLRGEQQWVTVDLEATYEATLQAGRYHPL